MATTDGPVVQLLALKVMRISRPELASAWQPFYSSSPSFSAHSSASILSLQGNTPLPGHPKTLRDFTSASEVLMLPASFGAIQLGETFSSCLCINNEIRVRVEVVQFKVEMQTLSSKVVLYETEGSKTLAGGETLEHVVHHEIKELGQHVLACTLAYRLPPNIRPVPEHDAKDPSDPTLQIARKFYKFAVTNPLSVKTKVHSVKSPSALFSPTEREKIFLEVHIQNLTQDAIYFERIRLECTDDWDSADGNMQPDEKTAEPKSIFSKTMALMQPQDMRQYVYILTPKSTKTPAASPAPGSIIPLGRLDMAWRSAFGEPGRLLTSMLSRRIPIPPAQPAQPASAVPQHLKKTFSGNRPHSSSVSSLPSLPQSRPGTPPLGRPGSPAPHRASTSVAIPSSPQLATVPPTNPLPDIEARISVRYVPRDDIVLEKPFSIAFSVKLSSNTPLPSEGFRRHITLAVQHLKRKKVAPIAPHPPEAFTPRLPSSGFSTPSSITATFNYALAHQKIATATPRLPPSDIPVGDVNTVEDDPDSLPPPFFEPSSNDATHNIPTVTFVGPSTVYLPKLEMFYSRNAESDTSSTVHVTQDFELSFIGLKRGFSCIGGIRILLVNDHVEEDLIAVEDKVTKKRKVQILKEYETVAEVWVS
ncbi:hypothetical protein CPB83DRAFT_880993 [Crepidotus variabilis]|uniref:DUF974-domain-containing protein n=1 Tax=Crepidotus variabilis TaxID=179855 RepID=A0A9P6JU29_9AGAR|nr:hypothetical protein CPB83DRAFT_880993 [Crepidotus variabilis]